MKKMILTVVTGLMLGLGCLMVPAYAAVPQVVPYQGQLKNAAGTPVNGVVDITFSLYTVPSGSGAIWSERHIGVNVAKGLFKVELGSVMPFTMGPPVFTTPVWLGIQVGTDPEMAPRTALTSAPFALHADDADTVGGFSSSQLDQSAHVLDTTNPHHVTAAQVGAITGVTAGTGMTGGGTTGSVTVNADTAYLQRRVSATCPVGQSIRVISATGGVTCQPDNVGTGDITGVTAGSGLTGGGTTGSVTLNIGTGAVTANHLATNSVGMDKINAGNFPNGTSYTASRTGGGSLVGGYNYYMSTTSVIPAASGQCLVTAQAEVNSDLTDSSSAVVSTAYAVGTGSPFPDNIVGMDIHAVGHFLTTAATTSNVYSVNGGTTYHFGCMIYNVGDLVGNNGRCRVSWMCM